MKDSISIIIKRMDNALHLTKTELGMILIPKNQQKTFECLVKMALGNTQKFALGKHPSQGGL